MSSSQKKMISVRVDIDLAKELDIYIFGKKLKGENVSKSGLVEEILREFLAKQKVDESEKE